MQKNQIVNSQDPTKPPRVVLLYRASSKMQVDADNDIPLQRNTLLPWVQQQGWTFKKELVEAAVSGYKVSADKRDAIQEIKRMAENKEFDVLGIYMSDRLGRIASETPLIVAFLNSHNISVMSFREGLIGGTEHVDSLVTYLRYWAAEGESRKTAARVADAINNNVRLGKWRGGTAPYGYKMVSRGTLNFKGRPIFDIEIDATQAEVVRTIFKMYCEGHYGMKKIAKHLNDKGYRTAENNLWNQTLIARLLRNKLYIGIYELNKSFYYKEKEIIESPCMEHLRIITDEEFANAQAVIKKNLTGARKQRPTIHGALLSGMIYCGVCGRKFSQHRSRTVHTLNNGEERTYTNCNYRCSSYSYPQERAEQCDQKHYKSHILEHTVIEDAKKFLSMVDRKALLSQYQSQAEIKIGEVMVRIEKAEADLEKNERDLVKLKAEIIKVLHGESKFSEKLITEQIAIKEQEALDLQQILEDSQNEIFKLEQKLATQKLVTDELDGWAERFDRSSMEARKAMLLNVIEKIVIKGKAIDTFYSIKVKTSSIPIIDADGAISPLNVPFSFIDPENCTPTAETPHITPDILAKGYQQAKRPGLLQDLVFL